MHVVEQALRIRFGDEDGEPTPADYYVALALDQWFEPLCAPCPDREATERIDRALFMDEMLVD
jgi:hypothetical protein